MNCAVEANTVDEMAKAGYDTTEQGTIKFLTGLGIKTGLDISKIDGMQNLELIIQNVGDIFFIKDFMPETMDELAVREDCQVSQAMLEGLEEMAQHTETLEAQYVHKVAQKRSMTSGGANVVMFPRNASDFTAKRDFDAQITPLSAVITLEAPTPDDVKELLTGLGIRSDDKLYFSGHSLRDAMCNVVNTMAMVKATCLKTLDHINTLCPYAEGKVAKAVSYMKCQIQAITLRENDYLDRIEEHQMYASGKVIPFRR